MKKILSKRILDEEDEADARQNALEDLQNRSLRYQVEPHNPQNFNETDYWQKHWISSEG